LKSSLKPFEVKMGVVDEKAEMIKDFVCGEASVLVRCQSEKIYGWGQGFTSSL
jgi:hypothetical protein